VLLAELSEGLVLGLASPGSGVLEELAGDLRALGFTVALSAPRRDCAALHEALREAAVLVALGLAPDVQVAGEDEIYRLLIGVLLRDPGELAALRERTISPLAAYDARHDTDLMETLTAFLAHDGSTTETADAMELHRHTVGYRLSRVHEVSGLSPYESDGRERLSLGLKAHQILEAEQLLPPPRQSTPAHKAARLDN
jgi:purine catabolism regulator